MSAISSAGMPDAGRTVQAQARPAIQKATVKAAPSSTAAPKAKVSPQVSDTFRAAKQQKSAQAAKSRTEVPKTLVRSKKVRDGLEGLAQSQFQGTLAQKGTIGETLAEGARRIADVNGDGKINMKDAAAVGRKALKILGGDWG